ncbi:MAG: LPS export ABC transporter permease LptF [Desulfuromonadaceae bacterium]|nr:LPS export ABC transporter permease LptF [Desulfuromonadaceae bacterium]
MSARRIQKYIFREIVAPMGIALVILTFVLLMGNLLKLTDLVINKGIPLGEISLLFYYLLPSFFDIALGMAFLIGILVGFSRLSADHEIIAMKSAGLSLRQMTLPVVAIALATSLALTAIAFTAKPAGKRNFKEQVFRILQNRLGKGLEPMVFFHDFKDVVLFAQEVDSGGQMKGVFLSDNRDPAEHSVISARTGRLFSSPTSLAFTIFLQDGTLHNRAVQKKDSEYRLLNFSEYQLTLDFAEKNGNQERRLAPKEMTLGEILAKPKLNRKMKIEVHKRLATPFAPLLFVLLGVPLGIHSPRSGRMGGFAFSLVIFLFYYLLSSFFETLCLEKEAIPLFLMWIPNLIFLAVGTSLFNRAAREKSFSPQSIVEFFRRPSNGTKNSS